MTVIRGGVGSGHHLQDPFCKPCCTVSCRLLSGLHFVHTSSVTLPATGLLPASKPFGSEIPAGGSQSHFKHSTKRLFSLSVHQATIQQHELSTYSELLPNNISSSIPTRGRVGGVNSLLVDIYAIVSLLHINEVRILIDLRKHTFCLFPL